MTILSEPPISSVFASHSTIQGWFSNSGFRVASSSTSVKRCGNAILVKDLYTITQVRKDDDGRFSQVEVDLAGDKLRFVSLYAPNTNPSRNAFFSSLPDFIDLAVPKAARLMLLTNPTRMWLVWKRCMSQ